VFLFQLGHQMTQLSKQTKTIAGSIQNESFAIKLPGKNNLDPKTFVRLSLAISCELRIQQGKSSSPHATMVGWYQEVLCK
jgi:hypothetical protein